MLYLEYIQDLLSPEKINIPIVEDPKTGEVTLPGAATRHAANTKMNTESSRSHAILMFQWVHVRRAVHEEDNDAPFHEKDSKRDLSNGHGIPTVRKSKLLIVDLAGSERLDKSGSEGRLLEEAKFINLSLTSLGKCINALAENSPHIPIRDSKLMRLLRHSFGGSARTSLIVTIGPSSRHHAETSSTIMFGQRLRDNDRFLAKENGRLEIKMKGILDELKRLKDHNDFMHDEVERLEMSLKHSKDHHYHQVLEGCYACAISTNAMSIETWIKSLIGIFIVTSSQSLFKLELLV
ncbi:unnamed protein product [Camellia sinensis]